MSNLHTVVDEVTGEPKADFVVRFKHGERTYVVRALAVLHVDRKHDASVIEFEAPLDFPRELDAVPLLARPPCAGEALRCIGFPALQNMPLPPTRRLVVENLARYGELLGATPQTRVVEGLALPTWTILTLPLTLKTLAEGEVTNDGRFSDFTDGKRLFAHTAPTIGGNSGSPMLVSEGAVGINAATHVEDHGYGYRALSRDLHYGSPMSEVLREIREQRP